MSSWMETNGQRVRDELTKAGFVFDESGKIDFSKTDIGNLNQRFAYLTEEEVRVLFEPADKYFAECEEESADFDFSRVAKLSLSESTKVWMEIENETKSSVEIDLADIVDLHARAFIYLFNDAKRDYSDMIDQIFTNGTDKDYEAIMYANAIINVILSYFLGDVRECAVSEGYFCAGLSNGADIDNDLVEITTLLLSAAHALHHANDNINRNS